MGEIPKHDQAEPQEPEDKKVQIVPVEQLIPGIKPGNEKYDGIESGHQGNTLYDRFAPNIIRDMQGILLTPETLVALKGRFKDKVVVDLGAGDMSWTYFLSVALGSKGYVGVEKFQGDLLEDKLRDADLGTMLFYWAQISKSSAYADDSFKNDPDWKSEYKSLSKLIPASVVKQDILSFLKRLPDGSVNVLTFGVDDMVLPSTEYRNAVAEEIKRVLHHDGMYITDSSSIPVEGFRSFSDDRAGSQFTLFKFSETRFLVKK